MLNNRFRNRVRAACLGSALLAVHGAAAQVVVPAPGVRVFASTPAAPGSFLGVAVAEVDSERAKVLRLKEVYGVEITRLEEDSPASRAGLKVGDVALEYNGQRVEGTEQFVRLVKETPVGRQVKLLVSRDGNPQTLTATIGSGRPKMLRDQEDEIRFSLPRMAVPEMPDVPRVFMWWRTALLGIDAESIDGQLAQYFGVKDGVLVRAVAKDSAAEKAAIKAGDIIVKVEDTRVVTPREITGAIRAQPGKKTFALTVVRDQKELNLNVTMDERSEREGKPTPGRSVRVPRM
jgi:serine protease Do